MCFNDNDAKLWNDDPHEYVRKGYDIIEDLYSPRTASIDFVTELVHKWGKENLQRFLSYSVEIFRRYSSLLDWASKFPQKSYGNNLSILLVKKSGLCGLVISSVGSTKIIFLVALLTLE